jgi:hypothetical protein
MSTWTLFGTICAVGAVVAFALALKLLKHKH